MSSTLGSRFQDHPIVAASELTLSTWPDHDANDDIEGILYLAFLFNNLNPTIILCALSVTYTNV